MKKVYARHWTADGEYTMRCETCRDTGYVRAFSPKSMRDAVESVRGKRKPEDVRLAFCDVPCDCEEGDMRSAETLALMQRKDRNATAPIRISDERVTPADPMKRVDELREILMQWAREYQSKIDERVALREAPFKVFEDFNEGVELFGALE